VKIIAVYNDRFFQQKPTFLPHKLWQVVCHRANPRSFDYMKELFYGSYPEGEIVLLESIPLKVKRLVVLYPDSIGLGQSLMEFKLRKKYTDIQVLNGRKRAFELTARVSLSLYIKRFLEMTFLCEILCMPFFLFYTISITFTDWLKGRL
jgi:hypothetical protein